MTPALDPPLGVPAPPPPAPETRAVQAELARHLETLGGIQQSLAQLARALPEPPDDADDDREPWSVEREIGGLLFAVCEVLDEALGALGRAAAATPESVLLEWRRWQAQWAPAAEATLAPQGRGLPETSFAVA